MRQVHPAGEEAFVDGAGQRPSVVDPAIGELAAHHSERQWTMG